jgi:hypothetical protein
MMGGTYQRGLTRASKSLPLLKIFRLASAPWESSLVGEPAVDKTPRRASLPFKMRGGRGPRAAA